MIKGRRYIVAATSFLLSTILTLELAANFDLILTREQGLYTVNPVALLLRAFASGRCFALWLLLDSLGACGIFWALYGRSYLNYRSDMYEVVPGFEIPKPEGQGQHGTAWWLPKNEYSVVFNAADTGSNIELPAKLTELYREERRRADEIAFAEE